MGKHPRRTGRAVSEFGKIHQFQSDTAVSGVGRTPIAENFLQDFGPSSPLFSFASSLWLEAVAALGNQRDFRAAYRNWRKALRIACGTSVGDEHLFVRHTYLATLAKLIAYFSISGAETPPDEAQAQEIIQGAFFEKQQIANFRDFFSWVACPSALLRTHRITTRFAGRLFTYRLNELSEDVLKGLYQALVDPKDRHGLGEYYTPDWLAARMCEALLSKSGVEAVLDPACGSGTFLYQAIQHKKRHLPAHRESLETILRSVAGMDIHPLAVIVSKVNVLLALGDLLNLRSGPISIPVYLANSIRPESLIQSFFPLGEKVNRPGVVLSRGGADEGVDSLSAAAAGGRSNAAPLLSRFDVVIGNPPWVSFRFVEKGAYQDYLKKLIVKELGLLEGSAHLVTHLELGTLFFARCANLYLKPPGRIGFILPRSIFAADQHDRFRRSRGMGNATLTQLWDLEAVSPLFSVPAAVVFGDLSGHANTTLPGEILSGRLRRKNASWEEAERDLKTEAAEFHIVQQGRRSFLSSRSCPPADGHQENMKCHSERSEESCSASGRPSQKGQGEIPRFARNDSVFQSTGSSEISSRPSFYHAHFREGATIVPRNFWFVEIKSGARPGLGIRSSVVATDPRAQAEAKPPYKGIHFEAPVEGDFLYATLLSTDLLPFGHLDLRPVVLPLVEEAQGYRLLNEDQARAQGYLKLSGWLRRAQSVWAERRKEKAEKAGALAWLNYRSKLTEQNPRAKHLVLYSRSATFLCGATLRPKALSHRVGGQEIVLRRFVAADSTYWFETQDPKEAGYLAALLNSPTVDALIKPLQARGLWGPRDIHKKVWELPIPEFSPENKAHLRLAEIASECAEQVESMVPGLRESFQDVRGPRAIGRARTAVRNALDEELAEIDALVQQILK